MGVINDLDFPASHYALCAVADTLHRRVAGLAPGAPGYSLLDVAPQPLPA